MKHLKTVSLAAALALAACGGDTSADDNSKPSRNRTKKDRGEATMMLGDTRWFAERATARKKGTTLTLKASNMDMATGKAKRQELHLQISDYTGPGDYKTGSMGSRFIGVGVDTEPLKQATREDGSATKTITDALAGASHLMLTGAQVTITAASDTEMTGTFSWQPPKGMDKPAITLGTFRALVRE